MLWLCVVVVLTPLLCVVLLLSCAAAPRRTTAPPTVQRGTDLPRTLHPLPIPKRRGAKASSCSQGARTTSTLSPTKRGGQRQGAC